MFDFSQLSSCEWIALASSLAISIGQNVTADEAGILSNFFSALGDNLGIISAENSSDNSNSNNNNNFCSNNL